MNKINEKDFWNIVKGVGILSIVIGHCYSKLVYFVYLYHLAIFFFVSGYFYNEEKYGDDPLKNFATRIKNNWLKYVIFGVFYTIMHNVFVNHGLIISKQYTLRDIITSIFNTGVFFGTEPFGGALWFVPVLILASTLFGYIIYFSRKIDNQVKNEKYPIKDITIISATILVGGIGIILNHKNVNLIYHIQTIFLVIPFFTAGYYLNNRIKDYDKYLKWYLFIPAFVGLCYLAFERNYFIELASNNIRNVYIFYIISFSGIYFCLYLSKIINLIPKVKNYFTIIGRYSFAIMASHFFIFKIIDVIYAKVMGISDFNIIGTFPYAFSELWPLYIILGCTIPAFIHYYFDYIIKTHFKKENKSENNKVNLNKRKVSKKDGNIKMKKVINLLNIIPIIFFTFILVGAFFYPANVYHSYSRVYAVLFAFIVLIIWYVVSRIINKIDEKKFRIVEIISMIIIYSLVFIIELIVMYNLKVNPNWDFGVIFSNSLTYFENGIRNMNIYPGYFEYFPNNIMVFTLDLIVIKIGNVFSFTPLNSCILMNTAFINLGVIFLYIASRKIYGRKYALLSQIVVLFFVPIFLYIPIFYSDTYSFYIPIGLVLFLTLIKQEKLDCKKSYIKYIISSIIVGLLLFLGKEIKVTSLIVFIAFLIFYLFYKNKRKFDIIAFLIILVVFITSEVLFVSFIVNNKKFNFNDIGSGSYPYTHWLMMGTEDIDRDNSSHNSYGGYNVDDYYLTNKYLKEGNAAQKNIKEYIRRVKKMGPYEYYNYLNKKAVNAWTDGYYFADVKLSIKPTKEDSEVRKFLFINEDSKNFMINFLQGVQFSFLIIFILGYIIKNNSNKIDILRLSIFGLMFFLLFWENRSRYIYNFIPIFILVITEFYYKLNRLVKKVWYN